MELLEYFNKINLEEIKRFIKEEQEENLNLEFKTVNHPFYNDKNKDDDKKNISKALSGFSNSSGGIIIWGIKAANKNGQDVATEEKPIQELTKFLNLLNRMEGQAVTPTISGIIHKKIEISKNTGFMKTYIPRSSGAPHMANHAGKHYYKRSGDSFYQCEHYDIIDMISRKKAPDLKIQIKQLNRELIHQVRYRYTLLVSIINKGNNIAKLPYLAMNFSNSFHADQYGLNGNGQRGLNQVRNNMLFQHNYSGGNDIVIYPEAILDVDKFYLELDRNAPPPHVIMDYMLTAEDMSSIKDKEEIQF